MVVISYGTIRGFTKTKKETVQDAFNNWYKIVCTANWTNLNDVKKIFLSADFVGNDRYVFNIMGNHYRVVVLVHFSTRTVYILWIGTHKQYDRINASTIKFKK